MQLAILVAVLSVLATAELGDEPVGGVLWRVMTVAAAMLLAPLAALVGGVRLVQAPGANAADAVSERLERLVLAVWIAASAAILFMLRWPQIVRSNWQLGSLPLLDELLVLAPLLVSLMLVWATLYRLNSAGAALRPMSCWRYVWLHVRHHLGMVVLPSLVVVGVVETAGLWYPALLKTSQSAWLLPPVLAVLLLSMPLVVRRVWRTSPLPAGALREELDQLIAARCCPVREILVWHTGGCVTNAAVVGLWRFDRYVLLTDGLVLRLTAPQVVAVVRHELSHLARRHLPLRLSLLGLPLAAWFALQQRWPGLEMALPYAFEQQGIPGSLAGAVLLPAAMLAYAVVVVGAYSRLLEHQADLDACYDEQGDFQPQLAAEFASALRRVTGGSRENRLTRWLHPSLSDRLSLLARAGREPSFAPRYHRRLRVVGLVIAAAYLAALLGWALCL